MASPISIAIVNDYEIVIGGIARVLEPFADRVKVVELDSRMPVLRDVDIVLYDSFGQVQGNQVKVAELVHGSNAKVVIFSWNVTHEMVLGALKQGASGYVSKSVDAETLVATLERVHAGDLARLTVGSAPDDHFGRWPGDQLGLSPREAEVLALICQGLTNQEIAERAFLGMNTIKTYIRSLYRKIDVVSRTQAVLWGVAHGFEPDRSRQLR